MSTKQPRKRRSFIRATVPASGELPTWIIVRAWAAHGEAEEAQVDPYDYSGRNREAEETDGFSEREGEFAFAEVDAEAGFVEPMDEGEKGHRA